MLLILRKIVFILIFNSSLFIVLLIGIQNSANKERVNLLLDETIKLPLSFIVGTSFIIGSITGSLLNFKTDKKPNN